MTPEQERIRANEAKQLLENRMLQEALTAIRADCFEKFQKTKFKENTERDELWRKLQTIDWFETHLTRIVTTGKMNDTFSDKVRNIVR